jgi:hypothetical protein
MNYACKDTELPGWHYPTGNGMADLDAPQETSADGKDQGGA